MKFILSALIIMTSLTAQAVTLNEAKHKEAVIEKLQDKGLSLKSVKLTNGQKVEDPSAYTSGIVAPARFHKYRYVLKVVETNGNSTQCSAVIKTNAYNVNYVTDVKFPNCQF